MMLQCWDSKPQNRPTFSDIAASLSQSLEAMADYLDTSAFGNELENNLLVNGCGADQPSEAETMIEEDTQEETQSGEPQTLTEDSDNKQLSRGLNLNSNATDIIPTQTCT